MYLYRIVTINQHKEMVSYICVLCVHEKNYRSLPKTAEKQRF